MIKRFLLILVLIFSLQSWTKADDIRDFEIEGISIGDSLLDYFSKNTIINSKDKEQYNSKKFYQVTVDEVVLDNQNFDNYDFIRLVDNKDLVKKTKINSLNDNNLFTSDSIKLLYSLPENNFLLIGDKDKNIYLAKIEKILSNDLSDKNDLSDYTIKANIQIKNDLYNSYDYLINDKYKITINQNTLERIKNYFRWF